MTRKVLRVVAGVLRGADASVLLAQRLAPKAYAGQWEFPGGKLEPGETAEHALSRELDEELGIQVRRARRLIEIHHDYPEFSVRLDTWEVTAFDGEPSSREGQPLAWAPLARLHEWPLLGADAPIITALRLPREYGFTPADASPEQILAAVGDWPEGRLLRLRCPALDDPAYEALAVQVLERARGRLRVLLDREPEQVARLGADGWHASGRALAALEARPEALPLCIASCHEPAELQRAREIGLDAAVFGPLAATPTHPGVDGIGLDVFGARVRGCNLPVYAIGGVGPAQADEVIDAGGQGVAGIRAFWPASASPG